MPGDLSKTNSLYYEIQITGRLSQELAEWFGLNQSVMHTKSGLAVTTLSGPVIDQAALFGVLNRIRDLGLKLISVNQIDLDERAKREKGPEHCPQNTTGSPSK